MSAMSRYLLLIFSLLVTAAYGATPMEASVQPSTPKTSQCGPSDGVCPIGCTFYEDSDCQMCNSSVGLTAPAMACSPQSPCTSLLGTYTAQGITVIAAPTDIPLCRTRTINGRLGATGCVYGGRGIFDDQATGSPHAWTDADGTPRYWCEFRPTGTSPGSKRPLLIYIPGSGGSADDVYDSTLLRAKAVTYDLTGDAQRTGYILVSVQGRNLHWPTASGEDGSKHDSYHRNVTSNRDVAFFDNLIDSLVAAGVADPRRIYLTGWSNGGRFAAYYGITRRDNPTPGGNRVAAVATYSSGDPFENIASGQAPSCKQDTYPRSTLPFLLISRNCDAVACNQEQYDSFEQNGWIMTPGNQGDAWIAALGVQMGDPAVQWIKIGYYGSITTSCLSTTHPTTPCTRTMAMRNHFCWPDGISDQGGYDREPDMLDFLRANPLTLPAPVLRILRIER